MMYVRYRQVNIAISSKVIDLSKTWNEVAFWSGNIICLGVSIVANFQETLVTSVHLFGATTAFAVVIVYFVIYVRYFKLCSYTLPT